MSLTVSGNQCVLTIAGGGGARTMNFQKRIAGDFIVIIVNMNKKTFGTTHTLNIQGSGAGNVHVVQYANTTNEHELDCAQLERANQYVGINNYDTSLVHLVAQVSKSNTGTPVIETAESIIEIVHNRAGGS